MNIAKALKEAREAAGMTQIELAANSRFTVGQIQMIEDGFMEHEYINHQDMESLASALEIPLPVLHILGIEDQDIAPGKKEIADALLPSMRGLVLELIKDKRI